MNATRLFVIGVIVAATLIYSGSSQAAGGFSDQTIRGTYGLSGSGTLGFGAFQAAIVGLNFFDGRGGCRISAQINAFGMVTPVRSMSCEYTVNPNGTGSLDVTLDAPMLAGPFHSDFVIVDNAKEIHSMLSDPSGGTVATVVTKRQTPQGS